MNENHWIVIVGQVLAALVGVVEVVGGAVGIIVVAADPDLDVLEAIGVGALDHLDAHDVVGGVEVDADVSVVRPVDGDHGGGVFVEDAVVGRGAGVARVAIDIPVAVPKLACKRKKVRLESRIFKVKRRRKQVRNQHHTE